MSAVVRAPCVVDWSTGTAKVTTVQEPIRVERFTPEHVDDPQKVADQLERVAHLATEASRTARSNPLGVPTIYTGLTVTSGTALRLTHGLGRKVFWWPVGFVGASEAQLSTNAATDANTLVLNVYASGKLDLAVA